MHLQAKVALTHVYKRFKFELGPGQIPLKLRMPLMILLLQLTTMNAACAHTMRTTVAASKSIMIDSTIIH